MPDQLHCLNCDYTWFPRYKKKPGLRKCPKCGYTGDYEVLKWNKQNNSKYHGKGNQAGSERTGCGFILLLSVCILLIVLIT